MFAHLLWHKKWHASYDLRACLHPCTPTALINLTWLVWAQSNSGLELSPYVYTYIYIHITMYVYIMYIYTYIYIYGCVCNLSCSTYLAQCARGHQWRSHWKISATVPPGNQGFGQGVRVMRDALLARLGSWAMDVYQKLEGLEMVLECCSMCFTQYSWSRV